MRALLFGFFLLVVLTSALESDDEKRFYYPSEVCFVVSLSL